MIAIVKSPLTYILKTVYVKSGHSEIFLKFKKIKIKLSNKKFKVLKRFWQHWIKYVTPRPQQDSALRLVGCLCDCFNRCPFSHGHSPVQWFSMLLAIGVMLSEAHSGLASKPLNHWAERSGEPMKQRRIGHRDTEQQEQAIRLQDAWNSSKNTIKEPFDVSWNPLIYDIFMF